MGGTDMTGFFDGARTCALAAMLGMADHARCPPLRRALAGHSMPMPTDAGAAHADPGSLACGRQIPNSLRLAASPPQLAASADER